MKQSAQTMLLVFVTMFSVAIGHAQLKVNSQWIENVQIWCIISMRTGNDSILSQNIKYSDMLIKI